MVSVTLGLIAEDRDQLRNRDDRMETLAQSAVTVNG